MLDGMPNGRVIYVIDKGLINLALANKQEIIRLYDLEETTIKTMREELDAKLDVVEKQITALKSVVQAEHTEEDKREDAIRTETKEKTTKLREPITELKRILNLMRIKHRNMEFEVYHFENDQKVQYTPIDALISNNTIKINAYIVKNRHKPTNKYALILMGKTIFNEDILEIPLSYGIPAHDNNTNIRQIIKDMPTEEALRQYYHKHKIHLLRDFLERHEAIEKLYREVQTECTSIDWKIAELEDQKEYYELHVSGGTDTPEYADILKRINDLKG